VQTAVNTENHLIVAHEVTNVGSGRSQLAAMANAANEALRVDKLDAVADRGYFNGEEIKAWDDAGITATLPKPITSDTKLAGRYGKQDLIHLPDENAYLCPAKEKLTYRCTTDENGQKLHRYWTNACGQCLLKAKCTSGKERRITRWEHEDIVEAAQKRLVANPDAMRTRREMAEHQFGAMKMRMGATHFLCKTLPKVATYMALCVLTYNLTRVMNIVGVEKLLEAIKG
jgi:Transposase DDE domain